jgi:protein-S-isoprenylcysteine O-methyltransferase Ste14
MTKRVMNMLERWFRWLGGGLFIFSLLFTAAWYAFWLSHSFPFRGWRPLAFDWLLFSVFALHHSALARPSSKQALSRIVPDRLLRSVYVWVASLLLLTVAVLWRPVGGEIYRAAAPLSIPLVLLQLAGLWLIVRAVSLIDALELAGIRQPGAAGQPEAKGLQTGGPYRLVRHPLYLGWMLVAFGSPHLTGDRLVFAAVSSLYLLIAMPWEERSLGETFGDAYTQYRQRVRWRILPYVY